MKKLAPVVALLLAACATPLLRPLPTVDALNGFGRVKPLMKTQGSIAKPLFSKSSWTDEEWTYTAEAVERLKVSTELVKTKFPHDEQWAQLASAVQQQVEVVDAAVKEKNAETTKTAFADLRRACNNCHAKKYKD